MQKSIPLLDFRELTSESGAADLGVYMRDLKDQIDDLAAVKTAFQEEYDRIRNQVIPDKMEAEGMTTITLAGVGRITVSNKMGATILPDYKLDMHQWLRDNGFAALVTATVNASTLTAFVKEQMEAGNEIPFDYLNITTYRQASLTKK